MASFIVINLVGDKNSPRVSLQVEINQCCVAKNVITYIDVITASMCYIHPAPESSYWKTPHGLAEDITICMEHPTLEAAFEQENKKETEVNMDEPA